MDNPIFKETHEALGLDLSWDADAVKTPKLRTDQIRRIKKRQDELISQARVGV